MSNATRFIQPLAKMVTVTLVSSQHAIHIQNVKVLTGLRQNACYINNDFVASCAVSCTPNTAPNSDGTCSPEVSDYSLQSPTSLYTTAAQTAPAVQETGSSDYSPSETGSYSPEATDYSSAGLSPSIAIETDSYDTSSEFLSATSSSAFSFSRMSLLISTHSRN